MRLLLNCLLAFVCLHVGAQGFNVVDLPPNNEASYGISIREVPDGFLVFSGGFDDNSVFRAQTALFDEEGGLLWKQAWMEDGPSRFSVVDAASKELPDGGFLIGVAVVGPDSMRWRAYRFNSNFDTTWTRTLGAGAYIEPRSAAYQAGSAYYSAFIMDSIPGTAKAWVARLDEDGNLLDTAIFTGMAYDMLTLSEGAGTDLLLAGGSVDSSLPYQTVVMRLDTALNVLWSRSILSGMYGFANCSAYSSKVTHGATGDVFVLGSLIDEAAWPYTNVEFYIVKLARSNGQVMWARRYPLSSSDLGDFNDMECLPDGDLAACGNVTPYDTTGWCAVLYRFDPSGHERWHRYYSFIQSHQAVHDLMDVEHTSDGGFILTGTTRLSLGFPTVTWLLSVDEFGCLEPGCQSVGITEQVVGLSPDMIKCAPVPASDRLSIDLDPPPEITTGDRLRLAITDLQGRQMMETRVDGAFPTTVQLDISAWPPGTYVVHFANDLRLLASTKFIVQ